MRSTRKTGYTARSRDRGTAYVLVLGASLLVALIGVSALTTLRVQRKTVTIGADRLKARELARNAIDRGMWDIKNAPLLWRANLADGLYTDVPFAGGAFTLGATDPVDGDLLDSSDDPVVLIGIGKYGSATYMTQVVLNGDGSVVPGSWKRVVN